jgi:C_GCAxxG_C_C family probable redox protein
MREETVVKRAVERFLLGGFNCAETVLMAGCEILGIKSDLIPKLATGFGVGMGRRGSVCGAISRAVMVIGLKFGRMEAIDKESKERAYDMALEFYKRFERRFGTGMCYELIGCDLTNPEERREFEEMNILEEKCANFVEAACKILIDLIRSHNDQRIF